MKLKDSMNVLSEYKLTDIALLIFIFDRTYFNKVHMFYDRVPKTYR